MNSPLVSPRVRSISQEKIEFEEALYHGVDNNGKDWTVKSVGDYWLLYDPATGSPPYKNPSSVSLYSNSGKMFKTIHFYTR